MTVVGPAGARRPRTRLVVVLVVAGLLVLLAAPTGLLVALVVAAVVAVRTARRRSQRLLATGLGLLAGAPVGFLVHFALQITSLGGGPAALLRALAVTAHAAGALSLVAGVVVLAVVWARACGQRTGPAVTAAAAVGAVVSADVLAWAWGRAFDLADAGRPTAPYDAVQDAAGLVVLGCTAVGVGAAAVTLRLSRRRPRAARPASPGRR